MCVDDRRDTLEGDFDVSDVERGLRIGSCMFAKKWWRMLALGLAQDVRSMYGGKGTCRTELGAGVGRDLRATMFWLEFAQALAEGLRGEGSEGEAIHIKPLALHTHAAAQRERKRGELYLC